MPKWHSKDFLDLQRIWYEALAKEGFQDHETLIGSQLQLTQRASNAYRQADELTRECKSSYFDLLSQAANQERFENRVERLIMFRRCEGCKIREISEELKELNDPRCKGYRQTIRFIIRKFENAWGIKQWTPEKMKIKKWEKYKK